MIMFARRSRLVFALAACALSSLSLAAFASPLTPTRATLPNGLHVVLAADASATAIDASLWFPAGTRSEKPAQSGLALLAARLTFRNGSSQPLSALAAVGGDGHLAVTPDFTSFGATVPAGELERALVFIAARTAPGATKPQELVAERNALRLDRDRSDRPPVARAIARLWAAAWPGHGYAQTGAPPSPGADAITAADIDTWRRARLSVSNATLTVSGAFDPDSALAAIRLRFGDRPRSAAPPALAANAPRAAQRARDRMDVPVRLCMVGWRAPGAGDADAAALELLAAWLGGDPKARLGRVLTDDWKLAIATQAGFVAQREGSLLWTMAVVAPEADSGAVESTLLDAVTGVTRQAPDAADLERTRRQVETSAWLAVQTARQRSQALGEAEMLAGDAAAAERRLVALHQVTPEDIQRVAARVMKEPERAILWVMPSVAGGVR